MKRVLGLACVTAFLGMGGAAAAPFEPATTTTVFRDGTGENATGPDIATVTVSSGFDELVFRVSIPTNATVTPDFRLRIWLDADESLETGLNVEGLTGLDHFLLVDPTRFRSDAAVLYSCSGSTCGGPSPTPPEFAYSSGATLSVNARSLELARIERVRFSVTVTTGIRFDPATGYDLTDAHLDSAPDAGSWTYDARALRVASFGAAPPQPQAGKLFTLTMRVLRTDSGAAVTRGKVTCALRVGGRDVPARTRRFVARSATCAFDVPAGTTGRRYRATIGVVARDAVVKRSVAGRVS